MAGLFKTENTGKALKTGMKYPQDGVTPEQD